MSNEEILGRFWHPVAAAEELGDKPLGVRLLDRQIALWRVGGRPIAFKDLCIHRGSMLSQGWLDGDCLVCPYHGWKYASDGACVRIPSLPPDRGIPRKARAETYRVEERYGLIWVCLGEPCTSIPDLPECEDSSYYTFFNGGLEWKTSAARMVENFIDISHFPFVHPGLLGDPDAPEVPDYQIEVRDGEMHFEGYAAVPKEGVFEGDVERYRYRVVLPFTTQFIRLIPGGQRFVITMVAQPISAKEIRRYQLVSRNFAFERPDAEYKEFIAKVLDQDRRIVENQRPEELPLDLSAELHLRGPDGAAVEYRRLLAGLGLSGPLVA